MSAHFAIPATTFVLRAILEARLKVAYGAFPAPRVSVEPPGPRAVAPGGGAPPAEPAGLCLFMHHAGTNAAMRTRYEPHVDTRGARIGRSPLVLDLHYLLAANGADLEREAVLGVGISALHRNGIVPRPMIQQLLGAIVVPPAPTKLMDTLTTEPLADKANQPESITISQQALDIDVSTKIWSALQSPMRPCAFYLVTTVFLDTGEAFPDGPEVQKIVIAARPNAQPGVAAADAIIEVTRGLV